MDHRIILEENGQTNPVNLLADRINAKGAVTRVEKETWDPFSVQLWRSQPTKGSQGGAGPLES